MYKYYSEILNTLKINSNYRSLRQSSDDGDLINFSSNDYLGLASNKELKREFIENSDFFNLNFSSSSSRLLTGNHKEYQKLENNLANLYQREACLVFNSGYHANVGILPALCGKNDLILADKSVHASIIDGLKLCNSETKRYNHKDYEHLIRLLEKYSKRKEKIFIISESIFSMDGDIADIKRLVEIKNKYNAILYLDEAHAVGTRGNNGLGYAEELSLISDIDIIVGTFGKALASQGAFAICNDVIKKYLINTSRSLIYTTALPPINVAWTNFIINKLPGFSEERKRLKEYTKTFCANLNIETHESNIIPIILGENDIAIQFAEELQNQGFFVLPIRHPTVPKGTARLRFSIKADLQNTDIINITNAINNIKQEHNIL